MLSDLFSLGVHPQVEVVAGQVYPVGRGGLVSVLGEVLELLERSLVVAEVEGAVANPLVAQLPRLAAAPLKLQWRDKLVWDDSSQINTCTRETSWLCSNTTVD